MKKSIIVFTFVSAFFLAGCDQLKSSENNNFSKNCEVSAAVTKAQLKNNTQQLQNNLTQQKALLALQLEVSRACVAKGYTPVLQGSNVGCQK